MSKRFATVAAAGLLSLALTSGVHAQETGSGTNVGAASATETGRTSAATTRDDDDDDAFDMGWLGLLGLLGLAGLIPRKNHDHVVVRRDTGPTSATRT